MGLFRTSRRRDAAPPDDALPFFTVDQANEFRSLVASTLGERGLEAQMHPDHAVVASGAQLGLWNVATQCAEARPRDWPRLVAAHVEVVLAGFDAPDPFAELTAEEAGERTYARLYPEDGMPPLDDFPHRVFVPGVVEMLALDLPESVAVYDHERASRLGGWEALRAHGIRNLRSLPVEHVEAVDLPDGGTFHALLGDSVYTASRALLLPELASTVAGHEDVGHGWLMSIPNRHQVAWHMVRDATVVPVVQAMAFFARRGHAEAPSPVSPHVYWWNGTEYEQLTHVDTEGNLAIHASPAFTEVLNTVVGGE